ncbi:MAG: DUF4846 domain-containing protein [Myxococcota bacterium]|nr:DUF4846 domain-containing protein [Myxococcota bacterium]
MFFPGQQSFNRLSKREMIVCSIFFSALLSTRAAALPQTSNFSEKARYPWLSGNEEDLLMRLDARFPPPEGFTRAPLDSGGFAAWLRGLPLLKKRSHVLSYRGARLQRPAAAVLAMDVGRRDLQQCADSLIRLHAEFLWHKGRAEKDAVYHFTSGDRSRWRDWRRGERFLISGREVVRAQGAVRSNTHTAYRRWLNLIFSYAGTRSLWRDSDAVGVRPLQGGDFFVQGGSPGHAVMLLDIVEAADGSRLGLIGQGFMPAEDFHILKDRGPHVIDGVWFKLPTARSDRLYTPSWSRPFRLRDARRFR